MLSLAGCENKVLAPDCTITEFDIPVEHGRPYHVRVKYCVTYNTGFIP